MAVSNQPVIEEGLYSLLNLFYFVKAKYIRISVICGDYLYRGFLEEIYENNLIVSLVDFKESSHRRVTISFEALNRYYTADTKIITSSGQQVTLSLPKKNQYLARRLYPRISFDDLFMRFIILYSPIMKTQLEEKNLESRFPYFFQEVTTGNPSTRIVYEMFMNEVSMVSPYNKIIFFEKKNSKKDEIIDLVQKTGKPLLIEDVSKLESYNQDLSNYGIITLKEIFDRIKLDKGEIEAISFIDRIRKKDLRNFLISYLIVPINFFERIIAYVRLEFNQFDKKFISPIQAVELMMAASLYSYAITKIKIRDSHFASNSVQTRVVNISLSGALIEIVDPIIFIYLKKNRLIKMIIPLLYEELEIFGEIVRFYRKDNYFYMGVIFFKSRPDDMIKLEQFIYENLKYYFF